MTAKIRDNVFGALQRVLSTKRGSYMLLRLQIRNGSSLGGESKPFKIIVTDYASQGITDNAITVNCADRPTYSSWSGEHASSVERLIAHELGHSIMGTLDDGYGQMNNVFYNENPIMYELGKPIRLRY